MQAICFDLDGTLVQFTRPYGDVLAETFEQHLGASSTELVETYDEAFYAAFRAFEPEPYRQGMEAVLEAAGDSGPDTGQDDADPAAMVETLREIEYASTAVDDALPAALESLGEDATLGVLTNGVREWQLGKLRRHGLDAHFDAVVASYEAGAHKPDLAPFELARERLPAEEHAMVGDDDADVEGARAAGFVPVRFEDDAGPNFWKTLAAML